MDSTVSDDNSSPKGRRKRVVNKDKHRLALLDAAAEVIATYGVAGTTVDRIKQQSELSRGMINLHFQSKENLFRELLRYMTEKYTHHWTTAIEQAGDDPLEKLTALIASDFSPKTMNRVDAAVWIAFRAEARNQDVIRQLIDTREDAFCDTIRTCCTELADKYNPQADPRIISDAITNLLEGFLLDFHLNPEGFDAEWGQKVCLTILYSYFGIEKV